jgi:hypothetical protein
MIEELKDGRFGVFLHGRCYGKYRLSARARQRLRQVLRSQSAAGKPRAVA